LIFIDFSSGRTVLPLTPAGLTSISLGGSHAAASTERNRAPTSRHTMAPMPRRPTLRNSDLRGAVRLATDAATGVTDLVEAVHERIARMPGLRSPALEGRTRGIAGLVYRTIRGVTRGVGGGMDSALGLLGPSVEPDDPNPRREALLAALNGVIGDHLAASGNPLTTAMTFRHAGRPLAVDTAALAAAMPDARSRVIVLLHGLCMNDLHWTRAGHDHGRALASDLGYTPLYLRYNSGLHISTNGRALAQQLEELLEQWPHPVQRLVLLGHSMGGLVARSAVHHAELAGHRWPQRLHDLVFLGTPHHGAPLERAGNWVDIVLTATPYAAPFARLGRMRSAGITDLRHGHLLDEEWRGRDRFAHGAPRRQSVPLPRGARCFTVAACLGPHGSALKGRMLGDGLVPLDSALGRHADPRQALAFAEDRQLIAYDTHHLDLLSSTRVYDQLRRWLA
jgi:hypothetical protein